MATDTVARPRSVDHYRNYLLGAQCLILANGPSLREAVDKPMPQDLVTIGVNQSWRLFPNAELHVAADFSQQSFEGAEDFYRMKSSRGELFATEAWFRGVPIKLLPPGATWSSDLNYGAVLDRNGVGSVTYLALQLAWWLGCQPIYICGLDLEGPKFTGEPSAVSRQNELFALTPPHVRGHVSVIAPTRCDAFKITEWPW